MKRIMVVDDDYDNRYTLKVTLEEMYSGCEAIDIYDHIDKDELQKSYLACISQLGV